MNGPKVGGGVIAEDGLMSVPEVARFLAISRSSVYALLADNSLPSLKIGNSRRIPRRAVLALVAKGLVGDDI